MSGNEHPSIAPVDLIFSGEFDIAASVEATWPHVLNYAEWQNFPIVEHVSGTPGGEGEVVRLKKETNEYTIGPYLARTLKLDPAQHVVIWKIYLDPDESNVQGLGGATNVQGNVEFGLTEAANGHARFRFNLIYEYLVPHASQSDLEEFRKRQFDDWNGVFESNWPNLRALAETGVVSHS